MALTAVGLAHSAWRNSCIENWHAEGRMHDGDMLRINSYTTWRIRQRLQTWTADMGLSAGGLTSELDRISAQDVDLLAVRVFRWLVDRRRKLPTGMTLGELAGDQLPIYQHHADGTLSGFALQAEQRGVRFSFIRAAAHGGLACPHWWGHPNWSALVARFLCTADHPGNEHWGDDGEFKARLPLEPELVANRKLLRKLLLARPWDLDAESAQWLTNAGIGYCRR